MNMRQEVKSLENRSSTRCRVTETLTAFAQGFERTYPSWASNRRLVGSIEILFQTGVRGMMEDLGQVQGRVRLERFKGDVAFFYMPLGRQ
jgi:hypothetical protein